MFNRRDGGLPMGSAWLFVVIILVVGLVLFGDNAFHIGAPSLNGTRIAGLCVMSAGLIAVQAAGFIAGRMGEERRTSAVPIIKLAGVLVCGAGALIVFLH